MATLSPADRLAVSALFQSDKSKVRELLAGVTKADLLAAVGAADDWADANKAAYNAALPLPARTALTTAQKAAILLYVITKRYAVGV